MRFPVLMVCFVPFAGLASAQQAAPADASAPAADTKTSSDAPAPAPVDTSWLTGYIDVGYRWQTGVGGSFDTYRTMVDLGSGPKLIGADFTLTDPKQRYFDDIQVRAYGWGDDPYSTFHLDARKAKLYRFTADYRDIAYFNDLPSYADPQLSRGIMLDEQSFDTRRRLGSFTLDLLPGNWFIPYLAYSRDSGSGIGEATFVTDANEFPVPNTTHDRTSLFRGGVRFELKRFHVTLEEGGTTFGNTQNVYQGSGVTNPGNLTTPFLGQTIDLTGLAASYGISGSSTYSKGVLTANVTPWLDFFGQFMFSQPKTNVTYQQYDTGNLVLESQLLFYTGQQYVVTAAALAPHTTASAGAEIRPVRRLRIVESWLTDRLHEDGNANTNQVLLNAISTQQMASLLTSSLATDYNQEEIDLYYDATSKLMLRGGYRYVWGDANDAFLPVAGLASSDQGKLRRNVGIGGFRFRPSRKVTVSGEVEAASSGGAYFRTSLYDYEKARAQARYQVATSLSLAVDYSVLYNNNPLTGVNYNYHSQQEAISFLWAPKAGKTWDFQGSYGRSAEYSNIGYLIPEYLTAAESLYRDNAHTATGQFRIKLPRYAGLTPQFMAGGSLFISSGSRPTSYFRPTAKFLLPLRKNVTWFAEWTYYDYAEVFYLYEGFRTNLVTTGLRFSR